MTDAECFAAATKIGLAPGEKMATKIVSSSSSPPACSVSLLPNGTAAVVFNTAKSSTACGAGAKRTSGSVKSLVTVALDLDESTDTVSLNLTGPDGVWFGVGFNASSMADAPYTIIVDGHGTVTERKLGNHAPGTQLGSSVTVVSSTVVGGNRTVTLTRPLEGKTPDHYTFSLARDVSLNLIDAVGSGPDLAYHKAKTGATVAILPANVGVCVCQGEVVPFGQAKGSLTYGTESVGFGNSCPPMPRGTSSHIHHRRSTWLRHNKRHGERERGRERGRRKATGTHTL